MTMQFINAYSARALFGACWGGPNATSRAKTAVPFGTTKASHQSGSLMIRTGINVWPLSPEGWSTG